MPLKNKEIWESLYAHAKECYAKGMNFDDIGDLLLDKHNDEAMVYAIIAKVKSDHYTEIRKQGLIILAIGLVLILAGFFITIFKFNANQLFTFAMYGLTSIGIFVVFWGLYKIIG